MNDHLDMDRLLLGMAEYEASDLHIKPGSPPVYRIASKLQPIQAPPLTKEETRTMLYTIIPPEQMVVLEKLVLVVLVTLGVLTKLYLSQVQEM